MGLSFPCWSKALISKQVEIKMRSVLLRREARARQSLVLSVTGVL